MKIADEPPSSTVTFSARDPSLAVTNEQVADLERRFGRDGVVELTYQIALENLRSRMTTALGITEQGFNSGDACRVPWASEATTARPA